MAEGTTLYKHKDNTVIGGEGEALSDAVADAGLCTLTVDSFAKSGTDGADYLGTQMSPSALHRLSSLSNVTDTPLRGPRFEISAGDADYPASFYNVAKPPEKLYVIGAKSALAQAEERGLAVVGARKATPYGLGAAERFARLAASRGAVIVSGGARGCDSAAHRAAVAESAPTVVVLGGGCDCPYPSENVSFFQQIIDSGGAVMSENPWDYEPLPFTFRERNRLIAGLAKATLIVEAGLPSGTFSTADHALEQGKDLLVVPGAITSAYSRGANRLIYQGAQPIVDDETFLEQLFSIYGFLRTPNDVGGGVQSKKKQSRRRQDDFLLEALMAEPMSMQQMLEMAKRCCGRDEPIAWLAMWLAKKTKEGKIAQYGNGMYGPTVKGQI